MEERLKQLRKSLGMTQEEFAKKLNIKRGAIANYEIGRNMPIDAVVTLICKTFGVSEEWLRTGNGDMFNNDYGSFSAILSELEESNDDFIKAFIETYMQLNPNAKKVIKDFIRDIAASGKFKKDDNE